jgi:hypothetical protein
MNAAPITLTIELPGECADVLERACHRMHGARNIVQDAPYRDAILRVLLERFLPVIADLDRPIGNPEWLKLEAKVEPPPRRP